MSSAHQNSDRQGQRQDLDESRSASTMSPRDDRAEAERIFARHTSLEVEAFEMDLTGLYGDPHGHVFAEKLDGAMSELEGEWAVLLVLAGEALHGHETVRDGLSRTLRRRREELEREFAMQQEAQRTGTQQPSLFGACTPEQALWDDMRHLREIGHAAEKQGDDIQLDYQLLQILKKHTQTQLSDVLREVDEQLKEKLILIEQIRLGYKEPWSELLGMYQTLRDSNGTMYQNLEDGNASSSKSSS